MGISPVNFYVECSNHRRLLQTLTLALGAGALGAIAAAAQMPAPVAQMAPPVLIPEKIAMGTFYDGARVRIEGTAPSGSGMLIVIRGGEKDEFFNRKGCVGFIWLNVDRIHFKYAPSVFLSFSSADASSLLDRADLDKYQLDKTAIMSRARCFRHCKCSLTEAAQQGGDRDMAPDLMYAKLLNADFLSLKDRQGSYSVRPHSVSLTDAANSETKYALDFEWPKKVPKGDYKVEVYACRGNKVIARSATTLHLVEVGFPAYVANLAFDDPWVYGSGAVLVALMAGFFTDAISSRLRRRKRGSRTESSLEDFETLDAGLESAPTEDREAQTIHHG
jgi:hypothetical protein